MLGLQGHRQVRQGTGAQLRCSQPQQQSRSRACHRTCWPGPARRRAYRAMACPALRPRASKCAWLWLISVHFCNAAQAGCSKAGERATAPAGQAELGIALAGAWAVSHTSLRLPGAHGFERAARRFVPQPKLPAASFGSKVGAERATTPPGQAWLGIALTRAWPVSHSSLRL